MARRRSERNLYKRNGVWYVEKLTEVGRIKKSLGTGIKEEAIELRDVVLRKAIEELGREASPAPAVPTFAVEALDALAAMGTLREQGAEQGYSLKTATEMRRALDPDGPILRHLGALTLDCIDLPALNRWYESAVTQRRLSAKTGANLLDSIVMVFRYSRKLGHIDRAHDPIKEFREQLRGDTRTKRAHAARHARENYAKKDVLTPDQVGALTFAARAEGAETIAVVLLAVECGLRRGEISALRWGDVAWGTGEDDPTRGLEVRKSNSSGLGVEGPKSGIARRPHVSRRLYRALRVLYRSRWEPGPGARVVERNYADLDKLTLRRCLERAGLPHRTLQNLRATASSLLKQWGVAPVYVRAVIGHADEKVADRHYDSLDFATYHEPEKLGAGEVPADLFQRLCPEPKSHHQSHHQAAREKKAKRIQGGSWCSQRESNPCLGLERAAS